MMESRRLQSIVLTVTMSIAVTAIMLGLPKMTLALAPERAGPGSMRSISPEQAPPDHWIIDLSLADPSAVIVMTDLQGNAIGEGIHIGSMKCNNDHCNKSTQVNLIPDGPEYKYRFTTRQAFDPVEERVVVAGVGTVSGVGQKEGFSFSATFQNNGDGTVSATYVASRPDASIVIPKSPGAIVFAHQ